MHVDVVVGRSLMDNPARVNCKWGGGGGGGGGGCGGGATASRVAKCAWK